MPALRYSHLLAKLFADPAQSFVQEIELAADPDSDEPFDTQLRSGNDQHAMVDANALAQLDAGGCGVISNQAKRSGARRAKSQESAETLGPGADGRNILTQDRPRSRIELLAIRRFHRDIRHGIRNLVRADRQIIVL